MDKQVLHESIQRHAVFAFSRSGGKGGQNVNKVNTKVQVFVPVEGLGGLTEQEKHLLVKRLAANINISGEIFAAAQDERTQERNRAIALNRIESMIQNACRVQKPRKKTKPSAKQKERRLKAKKLRSLIKASRQKVERL